MCRAGRSTPSRGRSRPREPIHFRFLEPLDPELFDAGWTELPPTLNPCTLNRSVWRGIQVSRTDRFCAAIRFDLHTDVWMMRNGARDRILILGNGHERFELRTGMSVDIGAGTWRGSLTEAFLRWRDELALHVYGEPGHQSQIREFVLGHRILTWDDVKEADALARQAPDAAPDPARPRGVDRPASALTLLTAHGR